LLSLGATEIEIRYTGGSLASVISYMTRTEALTILPYSVVFAFRKDRPISALPYKIPHPERALELLRPAGAPDAPAVDQFVAHVVRSFENLRHQIKRHEDAVVWGI
jgi:DNA-binding transcriptional LysR family regulator